MIDPATGDFMKPLTARACLVPGLGRIASAVMVLSAIFTCPLPASAQQVRPCRPSDVTSDWLRANAVRLASDTTAGWRKLRTDHGIPAGSSADVVIVQDSTICEAVTAGLEAAGLAHRSEAMVVVQVGQTAPFYLAAMPLSNTDGFLYLLNDHFVEIAVLR